MFDKNQYEINNIVGTGYLNQRLDLDVLQEDLSKEYYTTRAKKTRGIELYVPNIDYITIHKSGNFIIRSDTRKNLEDSKNEFLKIMKEDYGIGYEEESFKTINLTSVYDMDLNLNLYNIYKELIHVKNVKAEYEPEQFPAIKIYYNNSTILLYQSGKMVNVGADNPEQSVGDIKSVIKTVDEMD